MNVQFLHVPCIMYIVHALKVVLEDVCTNRMCQTPVLFQRYKSEGMLQYSEAVAKCHIQATIFFNFSVFFLKMLCKRRYWWWLMFLFLESLLVFPDLSFPLEYWICNYKKYMECRLYVQDRTQSNPDTRQTAVQCLRDGDLPCIENKNKRSQRKACLPLERQPIDGL